MKCLEYIHPETESRLWVGQGLGVRGNKQRVTVNRYQVSFWDDENAPELDSGDSCRNLLEILKTTELYNSKWWAYGMWIISIRKLLNKTVNNKVTALDKREAKSNYMLSVSQIH